MRGIFKTIGWRAEGNENCVGCGICADICPLEAITVGKNSISVKHTCIGCGLCAIKCPKEAIEMKELEPLKNDILDYFWGVKPKISG